MLTPFPGRTAGHKTRAWDKQISHARLDPAHGGAFLFFLCRCLFGGMCFRCADNQPGGQADDRTEIRAVLLRLDALSAFLRILTVVFDYAASFQKTAQAKTDKATAPREVPAISHKIFRRIPAMVCSIR